MAMAAAVRRAGAVRDTVRIRAHRQLAMGRSWPLATARRKVPLAALLQLMLLRALRGTALLPQRTGAAAHLAGSAPLLRNRVATGRLRTLPTTAPLRLRPPTAAPLADTALPPRRSTMARANSPGCSISMQAAPNKARPRQAMAQPPPSRRKAATAAQVRRRARHLPGTGRHSLQGMVRYHSRRALHPRPPPEHMATLRSYKPQARPPRSIHRYVCTSGLWRGVQCMRGSAGQEPCADGASVMPLAWQRRK